MCCPLGDTFVTDLHKKLITVSSATGLGQCKTSGKGGKDKKQSIRHVTTFNCDGEGQNFPWNLMNDDVRTGDNR